MHPILLKAGSVNVYTYGALVAVGFMLAAWLIYRDAPPFGIPGARLVDGLLFMLITGIIGARVLYIAVNLDYYLSNPLEMIDLSRGGLIWYGGFFLAMAFLAVYSKLLKLSFLDFTDALAPYIALAHAIGRIGCFFNGCCFGLEAPRALLFTVTFPGDCVQRYPTQIYGSLALIAIYLILRAWQYRRHFIGEITAAYCLLYSVKRFIIEFFRGDNPRVVFGMTMSQCVSILLFLAASAVFIYKADQWRKSITISK